MLSQLTQKKLCPFYKPAVTTWRQPVKKILPQGLLVSCFILFAHHQRSLPVDAQGCNTLFLYCTAPKPLHQYNRNYKVQIIHLPTQCNLFVLNTKSQWTISKFLGSGLEKVTMCYQNVNVVLT